MVEQGRRGGRLGGSDSAGSCYRRKRSVLVAGSDRDAPTIRDGCSHRVVINTVQIDGHRGGRESVIRVPAINVTTEHRVGTVASKHGMSGVSVVRAMRSGGRAHGSGTLRVDRLRGRSRRR